MIPWVRLAIVAAALVGAAWGGWSVNGWRLGKRIADIKAEASKQDASHRAKEREWGASALKIMEDSYAEAEKLRGAAVRADAAGRSLHDAGSRHAAAASAAPGTSEAAAAAIALHAELRRRADEVAGILGAYADAARTAGLACERIDAVTR